MLVRSQDRQVKMDLTDQSSIHCCYDVLGTTEVFQLSSDDAQDYTVVPMQSYFPVLVIWKVFFHGILSASLVAGFVADING